MPEFARKTEEALVNLSESPDVFEALTVPGPNGEALLFVGMLQSSPSSSRYLLTLAASTFKRAYQAARGGDPFSAALREVNAALRKEAASGQDQWLGNLAAAAAVVHNDRVWLSTAGAAKALKVSRGTSEEIPVNASGSHLFSAIAQGRLRDEEGLLLLPAASEKFLPQEEISDSVFIKKFRNNAERHEGGAAIVIFPKTTQQKARLSLPIVSAGANASLRAVGAQLVRIGTAIPFRSKKKQGALLALAGIIALSMLAVRMTGSKAQDPSVLSRAQELFVQAEAAFVLGEGMEAKTLTEQALALIAAQKKETAFAEELRAFSREIENVQSVPAETLAALPAFPVPFSPAHFAAFEDADEELLLLLTDPSYAGLWRLTQHTQKSGRFVFFPEPIRSGPRAMVFAQGLVFAATTEGFVAILPHEGVIAATMPFSAPQELQALASDGTTLYGLIEGNILSGTIAQLIKEGAAGRLAPYNNKLSTGLAPLLRKPNEALLHAQAIVAANDFLYVLLNDGSIARVRRNGRELAALIPQTQSGIAVKATRLTSNGRNLFLLDSARGRIARVSFNGIVEVQFEHEKLKGARDFLLLENGAAALVLTPKEIVKINLP